MFWRILRRLLQANRARLALVLLALGAGAAVTAALLNLRVDADLRLSREFRAFGANVMVAPHDVESADPGSGTLDESVMERLRAISASEQVAAIPFLYFISQVSAANTKSSIRAVAAGLPDDTALGAVAPFAPVSGTLSTSREGAESRCLVGVRLAERLHVTAGDGLVLTVLDRAARCRIPAVAAFGGAEDDHVFLDLRTAQFLAGLPGRISLIQLSVPGTPQGIEHYISALQQRLPEADVRGIRQFTEAETKLYGKISGLLTVTIAVILILTGLCVLAAMTGVAMERERDVGLMKALGGQLSRVLHLFLAEAALLGILGGAIGAFAGIGLSVWLGKAVFGVAARPRLIVYPVAVGLTVLVAIAGAFPLRRLAGVRPSEILRSVS